MFNSRKITEKRGVLKKNFAKNMNDFLGRMVLTGYFFFFSDAWTGSIGAIDFRVWRDKRVIFL